MKYKQNMQESCGLNQDVFVFSSRQGLIKLEKEYEMSKCRLKVVNNFRFFVWLFLSLVFSLFFPLALFFLS